ncbi:hypothetical protein DL96DRAFT_1668926 [Flagelloscypha sp. PMI_526]|nr:hypothetical protein DL96DRAFT_1668926 [Flagelloscypha sp. PMI_526]
MLLSLAAPILLYILKTLPSLMYERRRRRLVPRINERVLVIGASSGVGETLAKEYGSRGSRIAIVGRRANELERVAAECRARSPQALVLAFAADFANAEDMVNVRSKLVQEWGGIDTIHVCAGVSALRPLMEVAGLEKPQTDASAQAISEAVSIAGKAVYGNYQGPMVVALTFIPLLSQSKAPSMVLLNSLASLIPAPTRSIYASTKASSLILYLAASIEHPNIRFSTIIPATIEGDFRASAVDKGPVREADPGKSGLKRIAVARASIKAADRGTKTVWMPYSMKYAHVLYWFWPSLVEHFAKKKYKFTP